QHLSYAALDQRANQLAHALRARGISPEMLVAICVDRSLELVIGLLGILKAGGVYLPLALNDPAERLAYILDDAQVPVLLTQAALAERLPAHQAEVLYLDRDWPAIATQPTRPPTVVRLFEQLAYVIYTSG